MKALNKAKVAKRIKSVSISAKPKLRLDTKRKPLYKQGIRVIILHNIKIN